MGDFYNQSLMAPECGTTNIIQDRLGVAEALRDSSNVWFAQLAKLMNGKAAEHHDLSDPTGRLDLFLTKFMSEYDFDKNIGLFPDTGKLNPGQRASWLASPVFATPKKNINNTPQLFSTARGSLAIMNLVQTSIGQSLHVTPLEMAQVATLAATGNWFHPNLVKKWGDKGVERPSPKKLEVDLTLIHQGMAAVVQVGTAHDAFENHPDRCRMHGKTGTAQAGEAIGSLPPHTSAWFIGWRDPAPGQKNGKKLAFACMVTHVISGRTGGSVCAPIVAKFLREIR